MKKRIVIGITGSSGSIYGLRLLQILKSTPHIESHLVLSESAEKTFSIELKGWDRKKLEKLAHQSYSPDNFAASISSGTFKTLGMIIAPCSMKTLGNIAHSTGNDLISRAADVTLKEKRPLILLPRETPLHLGHLRNMVSATEIGAVILPPIPAFYHQPRSIEDLVDHSLGKALDLLNIDHQLFKRWGG